MSTPVQFLHPRSQCSFLLNVVSGHTRGLGVGQGGAAEVSVCVRRIIHSPCWCVSSHIQTKWGESRSRSNAFAPGAIACIL
eukprot:3586855-Karenia_brevis.AAC.1